VALWARWDAIAANPDRRTIVTFLNQPALAALHLGFRGQRLSVWNYQNDEIAGVAPPPPGWHHLAYTFDGTTHRLYVDGAPMAAGTLGTQIGATAALRIGASNSVGSQAFKGSIDDVWVFSRALAPEEIQQVRGAL
jgi:hypothetical protein